MHRSSSSGLSGGPHADELEPVAPEGAGSDGANPDGASHCYITFKGRGVVHVGDTSQELGPGTLVYFPPGVPHRLRAQGGPLDYFEIQAWKSFKTDVLSEEELGLKWYYDAVTPGGTRVEWDQS